MGRSGGHSRQWRRWHELGGRVLVLVCKQTSQRPSSAVVNGGFSLSSVRDSVGAVPCETSSTGIRVHSSRFRSSYPAASKCGIGEVSGTVEAVSPLPNVQQHRNFSGRPFSAATLCSNTSATCFGNGSPNQNFSGAQNKSMGMAMFSTIVYSKDCHTHFLLHGSRVQEMHNCSHPHRMSTATTAAGVDGRPEQSSSKFVAQEIVYSISPSHSKLPTAAKAVRKGGSIASAILDPDTDMTFMPRASKLPLHSALPSLRTHRLGEATLLGLHGVEATASMPAGDVVDWQQQRLGRLRDYDPRPRPQHSSPHSDAEPDDIFIPVKAFYISRSVDLKSLAREPFLEVTSSRNNLIIRCADRPPHSPVTADNPEMACLGFLKERYMVAFQYGSVVFFNFGDLEEVESLDVVRKYCSDEFREARKDDYGVLVRPTLAEWSEGGHDRVMLRKLDIDNIRVISSILGQSIALDHYAKKVDEMVTTFSELNRGMEQTGTFTMTRKSLFQLVAAANTTLADVILRLGLLERSDAAWKDANYAQIWEYLRDDFELDDRFESLDFKLNIIQHNVRFFLEILQNRKSDTLEWIIILLITGEICVSLYDILHTAGAF